MIINEHVTIKGGTFYDLAGNTFCDYIGDVRGIVELDDGGTISGMAVFTGNRAENGAAVYNYGGTATISDSIFTGNTSNNGGAVCNKDNSVATITDSIFDGNTANYGGGIYFNTDDPTSIAMLTLSGDTFCNNIGANCGAAIYTHRGSTNDKLTISDCLFSGNSIKQYGGAVYNHGDIMITGCTFHGNAAAQAGAINHESGDMTITNVTFSGNTALYTSAGFGIGGAIYSTSQITLSGVTFSGNTAAAAANGGGAIKSYANLILAGEVALLTESDTIVNGGTVSWDLTGEITGTLSGYQYLENLNTSSCLYLKVDSNVKAGDSFTIATGDFTTVTGKDTFTITGIHETLSQQITIGGNVVEYAGLNYLLTTSGEKLVLSVINLVDQRLEVASNETKELNDGDTFIGLSYDKAGGAVKNEGTLTGSSVVFSGNSSGASGGAIYSSGTLTLDKALFTDNTSEDGAGVMNCNTASISNTIFSNNVVDECGGAVNSQSLATLDGDIFTGNTAGTYGGAVYLPMGMVTLSGCTFAGNTAGKDGGAIFNGGGTVTLAGEVILATESDTFLNKYLAIWDLTGDTCGSLAGYQYLINSESASKLVLNVDNSIEAGNTFTIATGDFSDLTGKDTFTITGITGQKDATVTIGGGVASYAGLGWELTINGTGTDSCLQLAVSDNPPVPVTRADFNASNVSDVVIVKNKKLSILYDKGSKFVRSGTLSGLGKWTLVEPEGDYNGDTRADVLITSKTGDIRTLAGEFNTGTGSTIKLAAHNIFRYKTTEWSYRGKGDLNGDGVTDIVIVLKGDKAVEMGLKGRVVQAKMLNENGKVGETVKMGMLHSGECVLGTADVKGNGTDNILIWNVKNDLISYWKSAGAELTDIGIASDLDFLASGDLNGDNADEILWKKADGSYTLWENLAGESVEQIALGAQKAGWTFQQLGDYNGDGKQEVLWSANDGRLAYSSTDKLTKLTVIAK